jgi:hypothetical protein
MPVWRFRGHASQEDDDETRFAVYAAAGPVAEKIERRDENSRGSVFVSGRVARE